MKLFASLYTKILGCFFINLILIGAVLTVFYTLQARIDWRHLIGRHASDRMRIAGRLIAHDLNAGVRQNWQQVLKRHAESQGVEFALVLGNDTIVTSTPIMMPDTVLEKCRRHARMRPPRPQPDAAPADRVRQIDNFGKHAKPGKFPFFAHRWMLRTRHPTHYWVGIQIPIMVGEARRPQPATLLAFSDSVTGNGFFFDPLPWLLVTSIIVIASVLLWLPLLRSITRPLRRMTLATESIARGTFDIQIDEPRADEIGRLAKAINHMTARLNGYVKGQKRFLGDIAHELGSPVSRIQFGLEIVQRDAETDAQKQRLIDVIDDVAHMSQLVSELLSFSRAEISPGQVRLQPVALRPIAIQSIARENTVNADIVCRVDADIRVLASADLLARAIANIIRNAIRYAGCANGPILIDAAKHGNRVSLTISDAGPGVPHARIDKLFEPFYRPEPARDRESGGVGLGLAIVKTCVEACRGTVSGQNLETGGFAVTISLQEAEGGRP